MSNGSSPPPPPSAFGVCVCVCVCVCFVAVCPSPSPPPEVQPSALAEKSAKVGHTQNSHFCSRLVPASKPPQRNLRERWRDCGKMGKMGNAYQIVPFSDFSPISYQFHTFLYIMHFWQFLTFPHCSPFPPFAPISPNFPHFPTIFPVSPLFFTSALIPGGCMAVDLSCWASSCVAAQMAPQLAQRAPQFNALNAPCTPFLRPATEGSEAIGFGRIPVALCSIPSLCHPVPFRFTATDEAARPRAHAPYGTAQHVDAEHEHGREPDHVDALRPQYGGGHWEAAVHETVRRRRGRWVLANAPSVLTMCYAPRSCAETNPCCMHWPALVCTGTDAHPPPVSSLWYGG